MNLKKKACFLSVADENVHIDDSNFPDASSSHLSIVAKEETVICVRAIFFQQSVI